MARWLVNHRDNQFGVEGIPELERMAKEGRLVAGDLLQAPGATEWIYAVEVPELTNLFRDEDDGGSGRGLPAKAIAAALVALFGIGTATAFMAYGSLNAGEGQTVIGDQGGLSYSEMLVTTPDAPLHGEADAGSPAVATLAKDQAVALMAKRGPFYKVMTKQGQEGWVAVDQVVPMYQLGGKATRAEYDPLYNPDQYVEVGNAAWGMAEGKTDRKTVFRFQMANSAKYDMTDLKLRATVKDGKGNELEQVEFAVSGVIPAASEAGAGTTMVGTLMPEDKKNGTPELMTEASFQEQAKSNPDLQLRWVDGIEVVMKTKDFEVAKIDLVEIRAVPPQTAP